MNCISIAVFPVVTKATIRRVIEYFYPGKNQGKIWVDIFIDNPHQDELSLQILHSGSLHADDATEDSWVREHPISDHCAGALTKRIRELHDTYCPISVDHTTSSVGLDGNQYRAYAHHLIKVIGDDPSLDVPFTLWEIKPPIREERTVLRLRLEMHAPTCERRFADTGSFLAYGEAIVLRNIEDGDLPSYRGLDADKYWEAFATFKGGHKVPETFEYLIVSPDEEELSWDVVALSALISPKFIRSDRLSRTTRWFATDSPYIDAWEVKSNRTGQFILQLTKHHEVQQDGAPEVLEAVDVSPKR